MTDSPAATSDSPATPEVASAKKRSLLASLLLAVGFLFVALLICEVLLWIMGFEYTPLEVRLIGKSEWRPQHVFKDDHFMYDQELIWKPKPNVMIFNADGYRGELLKMPKPEGELRVIAVGDSNTLGWNTKNGPNWPMYYGELLKKAGINSKTVNAGVYGYTTYQGVRRLEQMLKLDPDLVFWSFGGNDGHYVVRTDAEWAKDPVRTSRIDETLMKTRIGQLILKVLDKHEARKPGEGYCRVPKDQYRANVLKAIQMCKEEGVQIVLLTRPYYSAPHIKDPYFWSHVAPQYREIDIAIARETGTPLVDFKAKFPSDPANPDKTIYVDDSHFTENGHRLAARYLFEETKDILPR